MPIRVLHVFPPNLKTRFGGQNITWKYNFTHWDNPLIQHSVADLEMDRMIPALEAFSFDYPDQQRTSTRFNRVSWIIQLHRFLKRKTSHFDIIHFHVLWWGSLLIARWAKAKRIPCIYESVLLDADNPSSVRAENLGGLKLKFLRSFSGIVAISEFLAQDYLDHGFTTDQVFTLMNSVDIDLFRPQTGDKEKREIRDKYHLPRNGKILIFVGSLIARKGVDILIDAFVKVSGQCAELYLLLVGPRDIKQNPSLDERFVQDLEQKLADNGLAERVRFLGLVREHQELAEIYRASDIFTFPSRREGLGNVVLEAMSSGLPVITSDLPVLERVIKDGVNGLVIPMDDSESLAQVIIKIYENEELAKELGNAARTYIEENHRFQAWQKELTGFYQRMHYQNGL